MYSIVANLVSGELDTAEAGALGRFLRIPVTDETQFKAALKLFAKHVDATPRQLVVQVRDDEVESDRQFRVHRVAAAAPVGDEDDDEDDSCQVAGNTDARVAKRLRACNQVSRICNQLSSRQLANINLN